MKIYRIGYPAYEEFKIYSKICYSLDEVWESYMMIREWLDIPLEMLQERIKEKLFSYMQNNNDNEGIYYLGNFSFEWKELKE